MIDYFLYIYTFEQQFVVLKVMLQSLCIKYHVQTIGIYKSLNNNDLYEHKCLPKNNKLYKHSGKCEYQQQLKDILEASMVSNLEGFTNNSIISPRTSTTVKKPSAIKSLCFSSIILDVKNKTATL